MATIGIDCRFSGFHAGIGRYTRELVAALVRLPSPHTYVLFVRSLSEPWLSALPNSVRLVCADIPHYSLREQLSFPRMIKSAECDLLFTPHFNVPVRSSVPFICTVHDMILHRFPNHASWIKRLAYRYLFHYAVQHARAIVTVSHAVREEVMATYHIPQDRIITVYPGVGPQFSIQSDAVVRAVHLSRGVSAPYILYVGAAKEHKNVPLLLQAFARITDPSLKLVLVIGKRDAAKLTLSPRVQILHDVSDAELAALYSGARAFVSASVYEGFGLPFAEALACGCPVVGSTHGSIAEVAGPYGTFLTPDVTVAGLQAALDRVLAFTPTEEERRAMSAHGASFRWETAAKDIHSILASALAQVH